MNTEVAHIAAGLVAAGESFALATIIGSQGSTPRHAGAAMLVRAGGAISGTVGGGPLEAAAIESALEVLASGGTRLMHYDSAQLGMMCGGGSQALIEYVDATRPANQDLYRGLSELMQAGRRGWLVVALRDEETGEPVASTCLVDSTGAVFGEASLPLESLQDLARRGGTYDGIVAGAPTKTFVRPVGAYGAAYVFGAGHCGEKLVPVLSTVGFFTVVVDDRADLANVERFPTADSIRVVDSFAQSLESLPVDEQSYIVIVTRGHAYDTEVLVQALRTNAAYVGMIGSKKKVAQAIAALRAQGFSEDDIARVHAPIGIAIGAETPEEIAISIAAQMIRIRHDLNA